MASILVIEDEARIASFVVKGLTAGMEIAVEDPTRPKEKKNDE